jgi:RimJ/RimL family protein N-acetyltransferase
MHLPTPPEDGTTERLRFESLRLDHAAELSSGLTHPDVYLFITGRNPATGAELAAHFQRLLAGPADASNSAWWNFVARRAADGRALGLVQAVIVEDRAEIAYLFGPEYWGHGYASESVQWLHDQLARRAIAEAWATVSPENARSIRLLQKCGYARMAGGWPRLESYEAGDWVFRRHLLPRPAAFQVSSGTPPR